MAAIPPKYEVQKMFKIKVMIDNGDFPSPAWVETHPYIAMTRKYAFAIARRLTRDLPGGAFAYGDVYEYDAGDWIPAMTPARYNAAMRGEYEDEFFPW
jgi:hypothetical protein